MTSRTGNRGFTLIEVLVASVILFAGLGAILKAYSLAVEALGAAEDTLAATDLLAGKAASLELQLGAGVDSAALPERLTREGVEYLCTATLVRMPVTPELTLTRAALLASRLNGTFPHALECEWVVFKAHDPAREAVR